MFERIVVGWDGSDEAEAALEWSLRRGGETPVVILHAVDRPPTDLDEERVEAILRRHPPARLGDVATRVAEGAPEQLLAAEAHPGTLIVVGTPARKRGSRWSLGARLAGRSSGATVAVIPAARDDLDGLPVVVGVDGSAAALRAVDLAAAEAVRTGVPVEIVHAWHPPYTWTPLFGEITADLEVFASMHQRVLDDALLHARASGAECTGRMRRADPAQLLAEAGQAASLLVVASHGYGPLRRFFLGSVSVMLLLDPPCPVLVATEELVPEAPHVTHP